MLKFLVARFKALQSRSDFIAYLIAFKKYIYRDMQFSYTRKPPQLLKALQLLWRAHLWPGINMDISSPEENYQEGITVTKLSVIIKYILQM